MHEEIEEPEKATGIEEKKLPDGLEEAAVEIADNLLAKPKEYAIAAKADYWNGAHDGAIAGAEWQKKRDDLETADLLAIAHLQGMEQQKAKMLEVAVEGEVVKDITNKLAVTAKNVNLDKFKFGDKVKIIVIKEDEK